MHVLGHMVGIIIIASTCSEDRFWAELSSSQKEILNFHFFSFVLLT